MVVQLGNASKQGRGRGQAIAPGQGIPPGQLRSAEVHLSKAALEAQPTKEIAPADTELTPQDDVKLSILIRTLEAITGKKIRLFSPKEFEEQMSKAQKQAGETGAALQQAQPSSTATASSEPAGFGIEYDYYERHYESESTSFSAAGIVKTADGREIAFSVDLNMSREFLQEQNINIRAGDAAVKLKDPLVINFGGGSAELTDTRFSFDIDSDGREDQIAFVGPNSGFLALDRNEDGKINDGSELFGATTGQGFAELAAYDQDGNQWIDENDSIYNNLRIWSKTADGQDQLIGLGQAGVGAIYLGNVTTPFSIKDGQNELLGQVRDTGIFLREKDGQAGTIQQIDLTV